MLSIDTPRFIKVQPLYERFVTNTHPIDRCKVYLMTRKFLFRSKVLPSCVVHCCNNWWRSPNFMYSTMTESGSSRVHTPRTRTMFASFSRDIIFTSLLKSALQIKRYLGYNDTSFLASYRIQYYWLLIFLLF